MEPGALRRVEPEPAAGVSPLRRARRENRQRRERDRSHPAPGKPAAGTGSGGAGSGAEPPQPDGRADGDDVGTRIDVVG